MSTKRSTFKEITGIPKQILGLENMFGYKTTLANQLYLIHLTLGHFVFTEKLRFRTKVIWFLFHSWGPFVAATCLTLHLLFGDTSDFTLFLYVIFVFQVGFYAMFISPAFAYWFSDDVLQLIQHIDDIPNQRPSSKEKQELYFNIPSYALWYFLVVMLNVGVYGLICFFDVLIFYEEKKVKNYLYYLAPTPHLENYATKTYFLSYTGWCIGSGCLTITEWTVLIVLFNIWAMTCFNELVISCNILEDFTNLVENQKDNGGGEGIMDAQVLEKHFQETLRNCIASTRIVNRRVNFILSYYEIVTSVLVPFAFIYEIAHFYTLLVEDDLPTAVLLRELSLLVATAVTVHQICRVGEILDEMAEVLSFEVYCLPWYIMPPELRKTTLQLLCQAQETIKARAMKMYPLNIRTFMRFVNSVYSTANFLLTAMSR